MTKNGKNYKMCTVKYNGKTYYVASMYLNWIRGTFCPTFVLLLSYFYSKNKIFIVSNKIQKVNLKKWLNPSI
jgi:hypothetical protein